VIKYTTVVTENTLKYAAVALFIRLRGYRMGCVSK